MFLSLSPNVYMITCFSVTQSFPTLGPHELGHIRPPCPSPSPRRLPKFTCIASVMPSSHLVLWRPLLLLSVFPSIKDFSNESVVLIRLLKYWSFSFSISSSNKYSGLISLKTDWFDLPAVQGTFRTLLQQQSSKASILWYSAFFTVQLS